MERILLCTDLDRTLLPNGLQPESPDARPLLRALCRRPEITLAFVSGRDRRLLLNAIDEYALPPPDYAIGDVGTTIYTVGDTAWSAWSRWHEKIASDWAGQSREDIERILAPICRRFALRLQEPEKQATYKLSYYATPDVERSALFEAIRTTLHARGIQANLIWSVDETRAEGLLDVLPESADKLHAVRFLMRGLGFTEENTLFAGDSGNDLPVFASGIPSVLVANATAEVRREVEATLSSSSEEARIYVARGGFLGMNGNYAAGILEGIGHYFPHAAEWLGTAA